MSSASPNKHQLKTEVTTQKLLRAAERVFARFGFEAATVEQIATEAGYTRGAFYSNFDTKEDLFFELLERRIAQVTEDLKDAVSRCSDPQSKLQALRDFYCGHLQDKRGSILKLEFKLYALRHPQKRAKLADRVRSIASKIPASIMDLDLGDKHSEACRVALDVLLSGVCLELAYDPSRITEEEAGNLLGKMFDFLLASE